MKKTLSIILALSLVVSMMVGLSFSASAGVDDYLANYDFVDMFTNSTPFDATDNGFAAYMASTSAGDVGTSSFSLTNKGLKVRGEFLLEGKVSRLSYTYALPTTAATYEGVDTMVYEFGVLGNSDMRAAGFGLSTANAATIAAELSDAAVVSPESNGNAKDADGNEAHYDSYLSANRLFLMRFKGTNANSNELYSVNNTSLGSIDGIPVNNSNSGYDVRLEYTPSLATNNLLIKIRSYNNSDTPGEWAEKTITVEVPTTGSVWPTYIFANASHGMSPGGRDQQTVKYLRVFDKADEPLIPTSVSISGKSIILEDETLQYTADVLSQSGNAIPGEAVTWSLVSPASDPKVTIDASTGELSLEAGSTLANGNTITIRATSVTDTNVYADFNVKVYMVEDGYMLNMIDFSDLTNTNTCYYPGIGLGVGTPDFNAGITSSANGAWRTSNNITIAPLKIVPGKIAVLEMDINKWEDLRNIRIETGNTRYWISKETNNKSTVDRYTGILRDKSYTLKFEYDFDEPSNSKMWITGVFEAAYDAVNGVYGTVENNDFTNNGALCTASGTVTSTMTKELAPASANNDEFAGFQFYRSGSVTYDNIVIYAKDADDFIEDYTVAPVEESTMVYNDATVNAYTVFVTIAEHALAVDDYGIALFIGDQTLRLSGKSDAVATSGGRFGVKFFVDPVDSEGLYTNYTIKPYIDIDGSYSYGSGNAKTQVVSAEI